MCFSWGWPTLLCLQFLRYLMCSISFTITSLCGTISGHVLSFLSKNKSFTWIKISWIKYMSLCFSISGMSTLMWSHCTCGLAFLCRCNLLWLFSVLLGLFSIIGHKSTVFSTDANVLCRARWSFTMSWFNSCTLEGSSTLLVVLLSTTWFPKVSFSLKSISHWSQTSWPS